MLQNLISKKERSLQKLVLCVLSQALVPEVSHGRNTSDFKDLLELPVKKLSHSHKWLSNTSSKKEFSWGILANCCIKIPITENLEWLKHSFIILQLGQVFASYCSYRHLNNINNMPKEIATHSSKDVQA